MKSIRFTLAAFLFTALAANVWADGASTLPRPDPTIAEFSRGVKFSVAGYDAASPALTNFPVLVRLSDNSPSGFSYSDLMYPATGSDICFLDMDGSPLAFEIDTWASGGTSLIWVKLPVMTNNAEFVMCYRCTTDGSGALINPGKSKVWSDYTGVWHLGEEGSGTTGRMIYDSTTNNLTGVPGANSSRQPGAVGYAQKISTQYSKTTEQIQVDLGANSGSAKRTVVDALVPEFSVSLWYKPATSSPASIQWEYLIGRRSDDKVLGWALQMDDKDEKLTDNITGTGLRIFASEATSSKSTARPSIGALYNLNTQWSKLDVFYKQTGGSSYGYELYTNGVLCASGNHPGAPSNGRTGDHLGIGGVPVGYSNKTRPFFGDMDEVRLRKGVTRAEWVAASYSNEVSEAFLTGGEVESFGESVTPVAAFDLDDNGAAYAKFSCSVSSIGANAELATAYIKLWSTANNGQEPEEWTPLETELVDLVTFSRTFTGLATRTPYSYKFKITNNQGIDSEIISGSFETAEIGTPGTGGSIVFFGEDVIHTFKVGEETAEYTFTPPSYVSTVRALVIAGGGPGGYKVGGGGGAGGCIYNAALGVTGGADYTVNVGSGGVASTSASAYGSNGGNSSIVGVGINLEAVGGGAGGNSADNFTSGQSGGSGGGSVENTSGGAATAGQGNAGGSGEGKDTYAGGGGGAGAVGGDFSHVNGSATANGGGGGRGFDCDISGVSTYYAGGGGGGGVLHLGNKTYSTPGGGGEGGGGRGGQESDVPEHKIAVNGTDGLGGGGGGGSAVSGYEKGGDGGDGIVIIRYSMQGDGQGVDEPIISLTGAAYNATDYEADVDFRVVWAGHNCQTADVLIAWGYAANNLFHTNLVAVGTIGMGNGAFKLKNDKTFVYLQAVATNALGNVGVSSDILRIYVEENEQAESEAIPGIGDVSLNYADGVYAVVTGVVTAVGTSIGEMSQCAIRLKYGTSPSNLSSITEGVVGEGEFSIVATNLLPVTTYYYQVELEDASHIDVDSEVFSFTTKGGSTINEVTGSASQRTITLTGTMGTIGASKTYLFLQVANGDWVPLEVTFDHNSGSLAFTTNFTAESWDNVSWKIMASNECLTATGESTGICWTYTKSGSSTPVDAATYTWQPVDGNWNGNWSDMGHWTNNKNGDCLGFPQSDTATASFQSCTLANPVTVNVGGKYTVKQIQLFDADAADISFVGTSKTASSLKSSSAAPEFKDKYMRSNSRLSFANMTLDASGQELDFAQAANNTETGVVITVSGADVKAKTIWLRANESAIAFRDGSTVTLTEKLSVGGTNTIITIDDSTVTAPSVFAGDNRDSTGLKLRFAGAQPRLVATTSFQTYARPDEILLEFAVPVGGYVLVPLTKNGVAFATKVKNDKNVDQTPGYFKFAVAEDSPALKRSSEALSNIVIVQTENGFATDYIADGIGVVPTHGEVSCGAFKYGLNGGPLEGDPPDLTTARQILLDLKGYGNKGVRFLVY